MTRRALTAAGVGLAPVRPPSGWFDHPHLTEPTPLTITAAGRVFGHAWTWDGCHIGFPNQCVPPPRNGDDYSHFTLGTVQCLGGREVSVGKITLDTGHAPHSATMAGTKRHYDDTGAAVADVTFGNDEIGGWFTGALRPDATPEQVRVLRASPVSGDWRSFGGQLRLVGLLAVNVPGFQVIRRRAQLVASGHVSRRRVDVSRNREVRALVAAATAPETLKHLIARAKGCSGC